MKSYLKESELAAFAKQCRIASGKNRAEAARELGVARQSLIHAEDIPGKSFTKLRVRIIEKYSGYTVKGPVFMIGQR